MKMLHIVMPLLLIFLLIGSVVLFMIYAREDPILMIVPDELLWYDDRHPIRPPTPFPAYSQLQTQSETPASTSPESSAHTPVDPPVDPPIDPPVEPPIIISPTDPKTAAYWLYYTPDVPLIGDRGAFNQKVQNAGKVIPIDGVKRTYDAQEVKTMIEAYRLPEVGYDENGLFHTDAFYQQALALRNLLEIRDVTAQTAVTLTSADVRAFPTKKPCYSANLMQDLFQEAVLPAGTPILLLHASANGEFYFVISYFYSGWMAADQVMPVEETLFSLFASPDHLAVVTVPMTENGLTMGTVLPLVSQDEETVTVLLPDREKGTQTVTLSFSEVSVGYVDATVHNFLKLSFSYLDTPYSWGDKEGGVDCSGLYVNVMRCMGIFLPRNTADMRAITEAVYISLENGIPDTLLPPCLIFRKGHVMLYLGNHEGTVYILHAPNSGSQVIAEPLWRTDNLLVALYLS